MNVHNSDSHDDNLLPPYRIEHVPRRPAGHPRVWRIALVGHGREEQVVDLFDKLDLPRRELKTRTAQKSVDGLDRYRVWTVEPGRRAPPEP